ncbi:hypothetical protein Pla108_03590 [Botrimarina colliarenosi]|uniref:DUF58 domain-containing protein n=1 Tax=Botrimarina colliarenosi TaxID=2528001 RepID=A0A5C6AHB4_9BACT|nr:DUF58 domain-containing protein [Botrimarina colliarenosi]TWT99422.1 hypothetical protein Pla108_03590 [Botrimarina colliarenosi]
MPITQPLLPPDLARQLERLELVTRKVFRGRMKGERRSAKKGQSVEFADYRNYVAGDDLRSLDWNLYARLDKLIVKLFLEEEDLHFYTLIDASPSMAFGDPTKLEYAKQLAAALGFIGLIRTDRVKVESLGGLQSPVLRGRRGVSRLLGFLDTVEPNETVSLEAGVRQFCLRNHGKGIVVLLTDLMDKAGYESAMRYLVAQRMDVYVIQILSGAEIDPDVAGDLRLVDCEDGDAAEVTISAPLIARYKETLASFTAGAQEFCGRRGMNYLLTSTERPVEELMATWLRKRGLVR